MKNSHDVNFEVIYPYQQSETYLSVKTDYNCKLAFKRTNSVLY
jgi:hypothetical protein